MFNKWICLSMKVSIDTKETSLDTGGGSIAPYYQPLEAYYCSLLAVVCERIVTFWKHGVIIYVNPCQFHPTQPDYVHFQVIVARCDDTMSYVYTGIINKKKTLRSQLVTFLPCIREPMDTLTRCCSYGTILGQFHLCTLNFAYYVLIYFSL